MQNKTIVFSNHGEIDLRVISTLGVNVKENSGSAIGYFGTGLKYAIAVLLREGQEVVILAGEKRLEFGLSQETIRGKDFKVVCMGADGDAMKPLGFTTEFGKNWNLENAYRELHSNCIDEGGYGGLEEEVYANAGETHILINGDKFYDVWLRKDIFILNPKRTPIFSEPGIGEIYSGGCGRVFYRGIAARNLGAQIGQFTYNILQGCSLSEDRELNQWQSDDIIAELISKYCDNEEIVYSAINSKNNFEANIINLKYVNAPSKIFHDVVDRVIKEHPMELSDYVRELHYRGRPRKLNFDLYELSTTEQYELDRAIEFCKGIGFPVDDYPIEVNVSLGAGIIGMAENGRIHLSARLAFSHSELPYTLIEEFVHLRNKVPDNSREMQNVLFSEIVRLGEEATGKRWKRGIPKNVESPF